MTALQQSGYASKYSGKTIKDPSAKPISPRNLLESETEHPILSSQAGHLTTMTPVPDPNAGINVDGDDFEYEVEYEFEGEDHDEDDDLELLAIPFWNLITTRVSMYNRDCPPATANFATFRSFWRSRFDQMREELITSQEADLFLTKPPLERLDIEILDEHREHECPCCLSQAKADIVIRAEGGITREIFLNAVRDYLYGEKVVLGNLALRNVYQGGLLVRNWDYMMQDKVMLYRGSSYTGDRIWMYCSGLQRKI